MEIHAQRYGSGEKVLFLHGAGGNARSWYFQKEYLKTYVEVSPVDMPGHGVDAGGDLLHVRLDESARGERRGAEADARGLEGARGGLWLPA